MEITTYENDDNIKLSKFVEFYLSLITTLLKIELFGNVELLSFFRTKKASAHPLF